MLNSMAKGSFGSLLTSSISQLLVFFLGANEHYFQDFLSIVISKLLLHLGYFSLCDSMLAE